MTETAVMRALVPAKKSPRLRRGITGVVILALILEIVPRLGIVDQAFLPPLSTVLVKLVQEFASPAFLLATLNTLLTWFLGLGIATLIAVPLGTLLGLSEFTYRVSRAVIDLIRPIPPIALIPLLILVLGQTLEMKLVLVVFAVVWPILFNTISGVRDVEPQLVQMARSFGYSRPKTIWKVVVPSAAPFMATGVRIASSIALIVVVTVEMIAGGSDGLGAYIAESRAIGTDVPKIFAGTLMTGILGLAINSVIGAVETRVFGWSERRRN
ncbi:ABC transporter permease [Microbacterium sp. A204]|uniref:ABC transporter permease n=1 Tax=Microbacterium sp. A204 TaxID=3457321 RepID=UPI003FD26A37